VLAAICAAMAASRLARRHQHFPSLTSRLRVAIKANPIQPGQIDAVRDTAAAILLESPEPVARVRRRRPHNNREMKVGLILVATLLGLAAARRRHQPRQMDA
jgi:hypothetical protein